jgi:hypothetical protein
MAMRIEMKTLSRLTQYVDLVQSLADADHNRRIEGKGKPEIFDDLRKNVDYSIGKKYAKVFTMYRDGSSKSLHSFVDMENGDIVKGSWKAPIRGKDGKLAVRGNIWADDIGESNITQYGPKYLR